MKTSPEIQKGVTIIMMHSLPAWPVPSDSKPDYRENNSFPKKRNGFAILIIGSSVVLSLFGLSVYILHLLNVGYTISTRLPTDISFAEFFKKDSQPIIIKTIVHENKFITPRKIIISDLLTCVADKEFMKKNIEVPSSSHIDLTSTILGNKDNAYKTNQAIWLYPFSTLRVSYSTKGDWYDYIYQYVDFDEIAIAPIEDGGKSKNCYNAGDRDNWEEVSFSQKECVGCVDPSVNGADIAVIDVIANDTIIWENGYISFIPIIKNIGSKPSGPFNVKYTLNGKLSSSFQLPNLDSGEIVNNFIAGSGFQGNFSASDRKQEMQLQLGIELTEFQDVNPENNVYNWKFQYTDTPQPKHSCTFTDNNQGPQDFYSATSISYGKKTFGDFCADESYVMEYLCDQHPVYKGDDNIEVFLYKCPEGCNRGACMGQYKELRNFSSVSENSEIEPESSEYLSLEFGPPDSTLSSDHAAVVYKHKMYVRGGYNLKDGFLHTLRIYDFKTGQWGTGPSDSVSGERGGETAVIYRDKMYVYTGNLLRIFDFETQTWSGGKTNNLDTYGRFDHSAVVYKDKMYIYGGGQSDWARNLYIYDFVTQTWSMGTASPENFPMHASHTAVEYEGKMYVFGGHPLTSKQDQTNTMLIYDLEQGSWSAGISDDQSNGRYGHTASVYGDKMYIYGGVSGERPEYIANSVRVYNFTTHTWYELGKVSANFRIYSHSAVVYNGKLYLLGGETQYFGRDITNQLTLMDLE